MYPNLPLCDIPATLLNESDVINVSDWIDSEYLLDDYYLNLPADASFSMSFLPTMNLVVKHSSFTITAIGALQRIGVYLPTTFWSM